MIPHESGITRRSTGAADHAGLKIKVFWRQPGYRCRYPPAEQFSDEFCDVGALPPLNALYLHFHLASLLRLRRKAMRSHCFGGA